MSVQSAAVALRGNLWPSDRSELKVALMGGTSQDKEWVMHIVRSQVQPYIGIKLVLHPISDLNTLKDEYDIRVGIPRIPKRYVFGGTDNTPYRGIEAWSRIGRASANVSFPRVSMYLGTLDNELSGMLLTLNTGRTIIHEFGHALGLVHEHSHPDAAIEWNKKAVYDFYALPPNEWSAEMVDQQVFQRFDADEVKVSVYDPKSIMHYTFSPAIVENYSDLGLGVNVHLSQRDIEMLNELYPGEGVMTTYQNPAGDYTFLKLVGNGAGLVMAVAWVSVFGLGGIRMAAPLLYLMVAVYILIVSYEYLQP